MTKVREFTEDIIATNILNYLCACSLEETSFQSLNDELRLQYYEAELKLRDLSFYKNDEWTIEEENKIDKIIENESKRIYDEVIVKWLQDLSN